MAICTLAPPALVMERRKTTAVLEMSLGREIQIPTGEGSKNETCDKLKVGYRSPVDVVVSIDGVQRFIGNNRSGCSALLTSSK